MAKKVTTELKALRAIVAHMDPDFEMDAAIEHLYTNHQGDLVYMPPAPEPAADTKEAQEAKAAAEAKEAAEEGKVIELKPKEPPAAKTPPTSAKAAASLQGAAQSQDGAGKPAGKQLEPDKMNPHEFLDNLDEILAQDG